MSRKKNWSRTCLGSADRLRVRTATMWLTLKSCPTPLPSFAPISPVFGQGQGGVPTHRERRQHRVQGVRHALVRFGVHPARDVLPEHLLVVELLAHGGERRQPHVEVRRLLPLDLDDEGLVRVPQEERVRDGAVEANAARVRLSHLLARVRAREVQPRPLQRVLARVDGSHARLQVRAHHARNVAQAHGPPSPLLPDHRCQRPPPHSLSAPMGVFLSLSLACVGQTQG